MLSWLRSVRARGAELNSDPIQRELAETLMAAAVDGGLFKEMAVKVFIDMHEWPRSEREVRIAHALNIVKAIRPDLYKEAKAIGFKYA